jgi:hypothetical protein
MAIHTVVGVRPGLEASVHASAWPLHLIRTLLSRELKSCRLRRHCLFVVRLLAPRRRSAEARGAPPNSIAVGGAEVPRKFCVGSMGMYRRRAVRFHSSCGKELADRRNNSVLRKLSGKRSNGGSYAHLHSCNSYRGSLCHPDRSVLRGHPDWTRRRQDRAKLRPPPPLQSRRGRTLRGIAAGLPSQGTVRGAGHGQLPEIPHSVPLGQKANSGTPGGK